MLDQELINACLKHAERETESISKDSNKNLFLKIVQLEQFDESDIKSYLAKICNNPMAIPSVEVILSIIRLYSYERLQKLSHINNPQAYAVIKDLEEYMLQKITYILCQNKQNIVINESKISILFHHLKSKFHGVCYKLKQMFFKLIKKK